jgi:hypothetical protein
MGLALFLGLALLSTPAHAQVTIYSSYNTTTFTGIVDQTATNNGFVSMQALLNGEAIQVNDKVFTNFSGYLSTQTPQGGSTQSFVSPTQITVSGLPNGTTQFPGPFDPGIQYTLPTMTLFSQAVADTHFSYQAFVVGGAPLMKDASQVLFGSVNQTNGSSITVGETITTLGGTGLTTPINDILPNSQGGGTPFGPQEFFGPVNAANVFKDIALVNADGNAVSLTSLVQQFSEVVPEPSTLAIAGLGALGFIGYGLRRRLKK